jgi:TP901 family phage tail tape measure protein
MAERSVSVRLSASVGPYIAAMNAAKAATNGFSSQSQANLRQLGTAMQGFGRGATLMVSAPLTALGVASTKMAYDFEQSFSRMVGLAEVPASEVDRLQEAVKGLSGETGRAPAELAAGLYQAASSGMDATQALEATTLAARASALGMGQAKDSAGLIAAATNAYGKENITAAETMDILTMAIREGKAEPDEMAHALGRVIPIAAQMGIGFDEVAGSVAYLSNIMGDTDQTVTGFRDALVKLNNPTVQGRETLRQMGTSFEELQAALDEGGLLGALDLLRTHGFDQNSEAVPRLFADVQGFNAASALLSDNSGTLATTLGKTADAAGSFSEAWQNWLTTDGAKVAQAFGEIKVAMVKIGEVLLPIVADVAGAVGGLASAFGELPGPVQAAAVAFGALAITAGPFILFAGTVIRNLALIKGAVAGLSALSLPSWLSGLGGMGVRAGAGAVGGPIGAIMAAEAFGGSRAHIRQAQSLTKPPADYGDNPAERFVNRAVGRAMPTGSVVENLGRKPSAALAGLMNAEPIDLNSANAALPGVRALRIELEEQAAALREAGIEAGVWGETLLQGAAWINQVTAANARLASEQDNYNRQINSGIEIAAEQFEAYQRGQEALENYQSTMRGAEWGEAPITAAATAMGRFNEYIFGGASQIAATEGAMDGLAEALQEIDTIGAGGLEDFNLATEEGRAGMEALQEVSAAWAPRLQEAVAESGGSVAELSGRLGGLRDDFIRMATDAGIGADEAAALADAIGLIPENAEVLIELSGHEEARLRLQLLSEAITGLSEEAQREIALQVSTGNFTGALATAQFEFRRMKAEAEGMIYIKGDSSAAQRSAIDAKDRIEAIPKQTTVTIRAIDNASAVARNVAAALAGLRDRTVTITTRHNNVTVLQTVDMRGDTTRRIAGSNAPIARALGGYRDTPELAVWAESGPEVILPLKDAARIRQLMADPRVSGPMFAALAAGGGTATGSAGGGTVGGGATTINFNAPIYGVDDLKRTLNDAFRERDARIRAGVR